MWTAIYHEFRRWAKASSHALRAYKRTEITVETEQIWIIRKSRARRGWCADCGREVDMVRLDEAGVIPGRITPPLTAQPMLPGCGDNRGWHWSQAEDGTALVCLESALKSQPTRFSPALLPGGLAGNLAGNPAGNKTFPWAQVLQLMKSKENENEKRYRKHAIATLNFKRRSGEEKGWAAWPARALPVWFSRLRFSRVVDVGKHVAVRRQNGRNPDWHHGDVGT